VSRLRGTRSGTRPGGTGRCRLHAFIVPGADFPSPRMPAVSSIHEVPGIGSGPIVIGQGCEFDYSGVQAAVMPRATALAADS
jgi:hypothetical protein